MNSMNERDRVIKVMQSEGMNAKQFCHEVGISQGTLSNITGGRNKPSLDVLQAILRRFRAVSCDWLIMGVGSMYISGRSESPTLFEDEEKDVSLPLEQSLSVGVPTPEVRGLSSGDKKQKPVGVMHSVASRQVDKIVIFYSDGTFEER